MAGYRVYFFDGLNHIGRALDVEALDDDEAIFLAQAHGPSETIEVWQGARQISRLEPPS